jgi:branched-chain amino acid aminotransferase
MEFVNYNGEIIRKDKFNLNLNNRGFKFGDSIFETIRCFDLKLPLIEFHFERLLSSLKTANFNIPQYFDFPFFKSQINSLIISNKHNNQRIRFTCYRKSDNDIYLVSNSASMEFIIESSALNSIDFKLGENSVDIGVFEDVKKPVNTISKLKSNNVLVHSIAGAWASKNKFNNAVLLNDLSNVAEALNGNIFGIKNSTIYTPNVEDACIPGVIRRVLIDNQENLNVQIIQKSLSLEELSNFEEIFITNSISGIIPVNSIHGKKLATRQGKELLVRLNDLISSMKDQMEH